jgi:hypothetical protein
MEEVQIRQSSIEDAAKAHLTVPEFLSGTSAADAEVWLKTEFASRCKIVSHDIKTCIYVAFTAEKPVGYIIAYDRVQNMNDPEIYIWMAGMLTQ